MKKEKTIIEIINELRFCKDCKLMDKDKKPVDISHMAKYPVTKPKEIV